MNAHCYANFRKKFTSFVSRDIEKIRDGIAEQVSHFLNLVMGFFICLVMSLIFGWKLTLVMVSYIPIIVITNAIVGKVSAFEQFND